MTITITATILPAAAGTTVSNQGTISYDSDGNGTNDATAQTDDPAVGGRRQSDQHRGRWRAPLPPIPTLSDFGLLLLAAALAGDGPRGDEAPPDRSGRLGTVR